MATDKLLSPDTSPDTVAKTIGVRRVNNLPLYIFGAIMLIFMLLMGIVAMNRATDRNNLSGYEHDHDTDSSSNFANLIAKDYLGGIIEPKLQPEVSDEPQTISLLDGIIIERPTDLDLPPALPLDHSNTSRDAELEHIRLLKRQQLEEAIKAKTSVNVIAPEVQLPRRNIPIRAVHRHARKHLQRWPECASRSMQTCVKTQLLPIMHALRTCGKDKVAWVLGLAPVSVRIMTIQRQCY